MTEKQVSRYIDLVHRRTYILTHSGVDWKPEYASETEQIHCELEILRPLVEDDYGGFCTIEGGENDGERT